MMRRGMLVVLAGLLLGSTAMAQQGPARFRWQTGQVLTYRVEQVTAVSGVVGSESKVPISTRSKLNLVKRWQVMSVDAGGVATVQLSLAALRVETNVGGETILFDSATPEKSSPEMREQMQRYIGQPLAVLRIDSRGQVVEVKETKHGPASRYQNELPFALTLPDRGPELGQTWERVYQIILDPPHGTGEKHDAVQKYSCTKAADGALTIALTTALKNKPESASDEEPLLQFQPQGEVVFDTQAGILRSARLSIDKELTGHQGEGSKYRFQSTYNEEHVPNR